MKNITTANLRSPQNKLLLSRNKTWESLGQSITTLMNKFNGFPYEQSLAKVLHSGLAKFDRTGTATIGIHGHQSRFKLEDGFPLITTKSVHFKSIVHELLWLISGETNIKPLADNNVTIWHDWPFRNWWLQTRNPENKPFPKKGSDEWIQLNMKKDFKVFNDKIKNDPDFAKQWGDLGPVYGKQWRAWEAPIYGLATHVQSIDQIQQVVDAIKKQHETGVISRRMLVTAWNPADLEEMAKTGLPPCHCLFQFHSRLLTLNERKDYYAKTKGLDWAVVEIMTDDDLDREQAPVYELDLQLYQRSCDIFLGVPFNIASYALLLLMVAQVTNCKPGEFIHDYGDLHIYSNHLDKVVTQLLREPQKYPTVRLNPKVTEIDRFTFDDFTLEGYDPHPAIKADVAI